MKDKPLDICSKFYRFEEKKYRHDNALANPYQLYKGEMARLTFNIPESSNRLLKTLLPQHGVTQAIVSTLIYGIIAELIDNGFTEYDPDNLLAIVATIKRRAFGRVDREEPGRNVK